MQAATVTATTTAPTPIPCYPPFTAVPGSNTKCPQMTAFALSWEDVVAPMSFLTKRIGLQSTRTRVEAAKVAYVQDRYLQQALAAVEEQAIELLRIASTLGPVFLITEHSMKYMEIICSFFFPRLAHWLANADLATSTTARQFRVRVVAAPHKFANATESSTWFARVYQHICKLAVCDTLGVWTAGAASLAQAHQALQHRESGTLGLVSISAAASTQVSSIRALDVAPFLIPKLVHVRGGDPASALNFEHFFALLRTLQGYVSVAVAHGGAFSITL